MPRKSASPSAHCLSFHEKTFPCRRPSCNQRIDPSAPMMWRSSLSGMARTKPCTRRPLNFTMPMRRGRSRVSKSSPERNSTTGRPCIAPSPTSSCKWEIPSAPTRTARKSAREGRATPFPRRSTASTSGAPSPPRGCPTRSTSTRLSNGSQFFVCLEPAPSYDGQYTVFGHVLWGLETLDEISTKPVDTNDYPVERIVIESVKIMPREKLPPAPVPGAPAPPKKAKRWWQVF